MRVHVCCYQSAFAASQAVITMPIILSCEYCTKYSIFDSRNYTFGYVAKSLTGLWRCRIELILSARGLLCVPLIFLSCTSRQ